MRNIIKNQEGVAAIEFAISVSFLLLLFLGSVEITRYVLIVQKAETVVSTAADVTAQTQTIPPLSNSQFTTQESNLLSAAPDIMNPYAFGSAGIVIITDITKTGTNAPVVNWQTCGGGTLQAKSKLGLPGSAAVLPAGYTMNAGEEVIIAEVYYQYTPIIVQNVVQPQMVYRTSTFIPRAGGLNTFTSSCN